MTTKNGILLAVGVAAAIALFYSGCKFGQNGILKQTKVDTVVTHDTTKIIFNNQIPYAVHDSKIYYVNGKPYPVHDTTEIPVIIDGKIDTLALIRRFLDTAFYATTKTQGKIKVTSSDTVTQNRKVGSSLVIISEDTLIKQTTVLRPPKNFVIYYTLSSGGNFNNPLYEQGAGLAIKMPSDKVYQLEIKRAGNHRPMIEGRAMFPIKFHK